MNLVSQAPILIIVSPIIGAFLVALFGFKKPSLAWPIAFVATLSFLLFSYLTLGQVSDLGVVRYFLSGWEAPKGIEYVVDSLNGMMLVLIGVVSVLSCLFAKESIRKELPHKEPQFYVLFLLLLTGLAGISITGDAFNLYVLLEISALSGYALLALGGGRGLVATFNYVVVGTIGASLYLLGVGYLYIMTGALNMTALHEILNSLHISSAIMIGFMLIMVGMWIKMAFFPVHDWLPNAYFYAPSATAAFGAPLMTKVSVYVMVRMMFSVFSEDYVFFTLNMNTLVVWVATIAIVLGSLSALAQKDIKRMLTYIIIAEVGYMVGGIWLATTNGFIGGVYHIFSDALMTLCLFLSIGAITYKLGSTKLSNMKGIFRKMPVTMIGFLVGALSMIGIPPTSGFFSKWYLISGAYQAGHWGFLVALLFAGLVNAILFFRVFEIGFFKDGDEPEVERAEAPVSMLVPILLSASLLIIVGLGTGTIVTQFIYPLIPGGLF